MKHQPTLLRAALIAVLGVASLSAQAVTLRVGNQGDALSMDPHSLNESLQLSVTENVYEPLVTRDRNYNLAPALLLEREIGPVVAHLARQHL
ncbi:MAG TPA: hypothetical protein VEA35_17400, partial [Ramlibacter sp.]|nr:hypothetical protein [Ramlibacter sp.]